MDQLWLVVIVVSVVLAVAAFFAVGVKRAARSKPAAKSQEIETRASSSLESLQVEPEEETTALEILESSSPKQASIKTEPGALFENIPRTMKVRQRYPVEVRIGTKDAADIKLGFAGPAQVESHDIMIVETMAVSLFSPDAAFSIDPTSDKEQLVKKEVLHALGLIGGAQYGHWTWFVTPLKPGEHSLALRVSARVLDSQGTPTGHTLPDQIINIKVKIDFVRSGIRITKWAAVAAAGALISAIVGAAVQDQQFWPALRKFGSDTAERWSPFSSSPQPETDNASEFNDIEKAN